jgi:hypothetical protein
VDLISVDAYESPDKAKRDLDVLLADYMNEYGLFLESGAADPAAAGKPFGLGEFGTSRKDATSKADWYASALSAIGSDKRIRFHFLYNARNGSQDFSIGGLGERLKAAWAHTRFQFRFPAPVAKR